MMVSGDQGNSGVWPFYSCHTLASYTSLGAVPFIRMHTPTVGQNSRNPVTFTVYEGETHRRPTPEGNDWLGFESLWANHLSRSLLRGC